MKKHFICLANSFKYQGRCLAGIEITLNESGYSVVAKEDGTPKWIRPVSRAGYGELSVSETQNMNMLDIIEIEGVEECPNNAHNENVFYSSLKRSGKKIGQNTNNLNGLCDNIHSKIFFNRGKAVPADIFQQSNHSLMFVKALNSIFYNDERNKLRVKFSFSGAEYDLPVTDPIFINYMQVKGLDSVNAVDKYYFAISLGEEFDGWHYKLIAGIITIPNEI